MANQPKYYIYCSDEGIEKIQSPIGEQKLNESDIVIVINTDGNVRAVTKANAAGELDPKINITAPPRECDLTKNKNIQETGIVKSNEKEYWECLYQIRKYFFWETTESLEVGNSISIQDNTLDAVEGDWMIVAHSGQEGFAQYYDGEWKISRVKQVNNDSNLIPNGKVEMNAFLERLSGYEPHYYLMNFQQGDIKCNELSAKTQPYYFPYIKNNPPIPGDFVVILQNQATTGRQSSGALKAAGTFQNSTQDEDSIVVTIDEDTLLFESVDFNKCKKVILGEDTKIPTPTDSALQHAYPIEKKDYDKLETYLKSNHEPRNYYYIGLAQTNLDLFAGNGNDRDSFHKIQRADFESVFQPDKNDLVLFFRPEGSGNPEFYSRYLGRICIVNTNDIGFDVIKIEKISKTQMQQNKTELCTLDLPIQKIVVYMQCQTKHTTI